MGRGSAFEYKVAEPGLIQGLGSSRNEIVEKKSRLRLTPWDCVMFSIGSQRLQNYPLLKSLLSASAWYQQMWRISVESRDPGCQRESSAHLWEEWRETRSQGDSLPGHPAYQTWASLATGQGESRQSDWCRWPFWKSLFCLDTNFAPVE